ncbi:lysylphosphatidylglycerol synthase transmembrane domain-containing protein [Levilactobacillus bambusae]|uniref:Phosphatidylglycerol lysyltransferase n=1 Tax=Levilactobacillus bambusae TaxID=2024736 RepID=A0A2V1MXW5_9LACO|nr:lysylphosphatidylglycerol synthase transmembrane domain-containing protein [Levilactobacillus bambusae]PWF99890.1 hypothetical protein DCM90_02760 [Levilactobacillus bambusae]
MTRRNKIALAIMFLVGVGIFAFSLRKIKLHALWNDLLHINLWWFAVAVLCMLLYLGLEGLIVKVFISSRISGFTFRDAVRVPAIEQLFNGITPFSTGGQPAQLIALMQAGVDGGRASSVLLMKFVVYQAMIVVNFIIALLIGFNYIVEKMHALALLVLFGFLIHLGVIIGLLLVMYWPRFTKKLVSLCLIPVGWFMKQERLDGIKRQLDEKLDNFYHESLRISHEWKMMAKIFLITFFQLLAYYLIPYFIMLALGYTHVNIVMVTCLHILIVIVISLFPIPGGSGGAEYSFEALFGSFITSSSKLVLAMLLWRILTYYLGMLSGLIALVIPPTKVQDSTDDK